MVNTDNWDSQEGLIADGLVVGFCRAGAAIAAGDAVTFGTAAANQVNVITAHAAATVGKGIGVALKAASTGDILPVIYFGVVKMTAGETIVIGDILISGLAAGQVFGVGASNSLLLNTAGTQYVLGIAIQEATTIGDELLVLVGRSG